MSDMKLSHAEDAGGDRQERLEGYHACGSLLWLGCGIWKLCRAPFLVPTKKEQPSGVTVCTRQGNGLL